MVKKKRIEISADEAELCQYLDNGMYDTIINGKEKIIIISLLIGLVAIVGVVFAAFSSALL